MSSSQLFLAIVVYVTSVVIALVFLLASSPWFISTRSDFSPLNLTSAYSFAFTRLSRFDQFLFLDCFLKWTLPTAPQIVNLSAQMWESVNWSMLPQRVTFTNNISNAIRIYTANSIHTSHFRVNLSLWFGQFPRASGTFVWSLGNRAHAIAAVFLRVLCAAFGAVLLAQLPAGGGLRLLFLLAIGIIVASNPLHVLAVLFSWPLLHACDCIARLVVVFAGVLFVPYSGLRPPASLFRQCFPFLLAFPVVAYFSVHAALSAARVPVIEPNQAVRTVRIVAVEGYLIIVAAIAIRNRAKRAAVLAATVFPAAILASEIGFIAWPRRAGAAQLFELVLTVEHIVFYLFVKWPVQPEREYRESTVGAQPDGGREAEGMLSNSVIEL
jgi:hypothetical protein